MSLDVHRLKRIAKRWHDEQKIAAQDVTWVLHELDRVTTEAAAASLRSPGRKLIDDIFGGLR